jgi:16S rRNA (guanine1516-N2)-methyltransferase
MAIKFIKAGEEVSPPENIRELTEFAQFRELELVFEWRNGQLWLHSDQKGERPIGLELDRELDRHLNYFKKSSLHKELLARSIGIKGTYRPHVLDLTAGLLGDSLLLLAMGCEVTALERHPVVSFLIESALKNAEHPLLKNFSFIKAEALGFLEASSSLLWDVLYYDPMFEDANEKTLPRKEMRIFRSLVGEDLDATKVFELALMKRPKRLVVKRPRLSRTITTETPLQYVGKATRYDVYLAQNHGPNESNHIK